MLFIGKRFYTNRDALFERFGRIYQLPYNCAQAGTPTRLWLVDYHTRVAISRLDGDLCVYATPVFGWRFFWRLFREILPHTRSSARFQVVVASGDCYIGLLGYAIARLTGAVFVFDVYDKYDEFSAYRRVWRFDPLRYLLSNADAVCFASHALAAAIGTNVRDSLVVPNGINPDDFRQRDRLDSRTRLNLHKDRAYVGYFGSMEPERGVDDLIEAVSLVRERYQDLELIIAGKPRDDLDLHRKWIHYLGNLPFTEVPYALGACDVLALPYRNSPFLDMASSCKIAEYMASQRPIVATRTPNLVENFPAQSDELGDLLADPGDPHGIADSLHRQLTEPKLVGVPENMEWRSISETFSRFLRDTLAHKRR